ncbi:MAG TPA: WYL domain-containing protein, partial [Bacteroidia bacterium]|nr:WYL domain-containing protein [Bacteroidia bacterium]
YSFGITRLNEKPIKIILLFEPQQGSYVKSLPIHSTQKILTDNKNGLKVQIRVIPSIELYQYLLGQASKVKIIFPANLASEVKKIHKQAGE